VDDAANHAKILIRFDPDSEYYERISIYRRNSPGTHIGILEADPIDDLSEDVTAHSGVAMI